MPGPGPSFGGDTPMSPDAPKNTTPSEAALYHDAYLNQSAAFNLASEAVKNHQAVVKDGGIIDFSDPKLTDQYNALIGNFNSDLSKMDAFCAAREAEKLAAGAKQADIGGLGCQNIIQGTAFEQYAAAAMLF